jgi:hypothetical protein
MLFRYDFKEKLDLSIFRKQATHYISHMRQLTYHLEFLDFRIEIDIIEPDNNHNAHLMELFISEIERNDDGEVRQAVAIFPLSDLRFKELGVIQRIFPLDDYKTSIVSNSVEKTVDTICRLAKIVFKINNLKAFL